MDTYRCRYLLVRARTKRSKFMFCPIPLFLGARLGDCEYLCGARSMYVGM